MKSIILFILGMKKFSLEKVLSRLVKYNCGITSFIREGVVIIMTSLLEILAALFVKLLVPILGHLTLLKIYFESKFFDQFWL